MPNKKLKKQIRNKDISYLKINLIIAGVIILMIIYSGIFSAHGIHHPIKSMYNFPVVSSGLSRSLSEMVRGNLEQARLFNPYGPRIFLFFIIQLLLRISCSILLFRNRFSKNTLLISDILTSVLLFLWAFIPFVAEQIKMVK